MSSIGKRKKRRALCIFVTRGCTCAALCEYHGHALQTKTTFLLIVGFVLLWNSGFIGAEYGLPYAGPFSLLFWRYLILTLLLLGYLAVRNRLAWKGWHAVSRQMVIGVLSHGVWLGCVLLALDYHVPAGIIALVVALQPLATGAFSGLATGEKAQAKQWIGLCIGFLGVGITVSLRIDYQSSASLFGHLIPLGSVIAITLASLLQRRMDLQGETVHMAVDLRLLYQSAATALVLLPPAWFAESLAASWQPPFVYTMLWLIGAVSLGAYALMWLLLKRMDAIRVASLFYLGPPVTMVMAWLAFGNVLLVSDVVGMIIVFIGVMITYGKSW